VLHSAEGIAAVPVNRDRMQFLVWAKPLRYVFAVVGGERSCGER
jgi:hypothetical protein